MSDRSAVKDILLEHSARIDLRRRILLIGALNHAHEHALMRAIYILTDSGKYGYAHNPLEDEPSYSGLGLPVTEFIAITRSIPEQVAAIDSCWITSSKPADCRTLRGADMRSRNIARCKHIFDFIRNSYSAPPSEVVLVGCFSVLSSLFRDAGYHVTCLDDHCRSKCPTAHAIVDPVISDSILITSASYLCRPDYIVVHDWSCRARYAAVISQTGHSMIELYFSKGFNVVFSESFPPFSLCESVLHTYTKCRR